MTGIAGNTTVLTGKDTTNALTPIFNADIVRADVNAQVTITAQFGSQASTAIGNYANTQMNGAARLRIRAGSLDAADPERTRLSNEANAIEANWGNNGVLRLAAHTVVGGLTGGASGAAGTFAAAVAAPVLQEQLAQAGITGTLSDVLVSLGSTAIGGAVGGTAGAAGALNEVQNNYLTPRENLARNRAAAACAGSNYTDGKSCGEANRLNELDTKRDRDIAAAVQACQSGKSAQTCINASRMVNTLQNQGMQELQQLAIELAPTCAPPRDCTQAANWGRSELSTLYIANQQLQPLLSSGAVQPIAPELALIGAPAGAARFTAWQLARPVEQYGAITGAQYINGALTSGSIGTIVYGLTNASNIENITPANLAVVFLTSAIGSGLVRRELNAVYGLQNTAIPYTLANVATHGTGAAIGFGTTGWLNQTNAPTTGTNWATQPIWVTPNYTVVPRNLGPVPTTPPSAQR
jgi:hypothetical protein